MNVSSPPSARAALGVVLGVGSVVVAALLLRLTLSKREAKPSDDEEDVVGEVVINAGLHGELQDDAHSLKTRVGNFKVSKLSRLVEDIAVACGREERFDVRGASSGSTEEGDTAEQLQTAEDRQIANEQHMIRKAIDLLHSVRQSDVHRKLPHFHVVDRQLETAILQLEGIYENVAGFWCYGREDPMADLLELPVMQLAADGGLQALVPVPDSLVEDSDGKPSTWSSASILANAATHLGVDADAGRRQVELAYRARARELHRNGECIDRAAFHALTEAYELCVTRRVELPNHIHAAGGDILANYLLVGTDPRGSRYREYSRGILDAPSRERLLQKIDVLVNWGEVGGSATGLGQG